MTEVGGRRGSGQRWEGKRKYDRGGREKGRGQKWEAKRKDDRGGSEKGKRTEAVSYTHLTLPTIVAV